METLKLDTPVRTREPVVQVDGRLPEGRYRVQLVVEGPSGRSEPATLLIQVRKT
jgi:chitodextrinase